MMPHESPQHRLLVIGCGSIGERHVRAFLATGRTHIVACDPNDAILQKMASTYGVPVLADWRDSLDDHEMTGAVIATPAHLHVPIARKLIASRKHVLIEKPLSVNLQNVPTLAEARDRANTFVAVAYVLHFIPALQAARTFLREGSFGAIRHVAANIGQHFPSFRPAYRNIYYRDHAQGGGAIQDALTHIVNAVEWIVGPATRVYCDASHQVLADVTVEDTVNVVARHGEVLAGYALNQFQAPNETRIDFHAETGTVRVEIDAERWCTLARGATEWTCHKASVTDRDELFINQAHAFLDGCEGRANLLCTLEEGIQTLQFNLAALRSWREDKPITP